MKKLTREEAGALLINIGIFLLLFIVFYWLFWFTYYIHETGHILFGFGDGLIKGKINKFEIGNWEKHPITSFIPLPQQVKIVDGESSLNFKFGGPIFTMIVFFGLSLVGYQRSKNKAWFLLFAAIFLFEISGNIICGTDNFYSKPLSICNSTLDLYIPYFSIFLFSGILSGFSTIRLKPYIEKILGS